MPYEDTRWLDRDDAACRDDDDRFIRFFFESRIDCERAFMDDRTDREGRDDVAIAASGRAFCFINITTRDLERRVFRAETIRYTARASSTILQRTRDFR